MEADLYVSDMGRTLRLHAVELDQLATLHEAFESLGSARLNTYDLKSILRAPMLTSFKADSDDRQPRHARSLFLDERGEGTALRWVRARDDWQTVALLVEGLMHEGQPGHQYLTEEGLDDVIVELSFREW